MLVSLSLRSSHTSSLFRYFVFIRVSDEKQFHTQLNRSKLNYNLSGVLSEELVT